MWVYICGTMLGALHAAVHLEMQNAEFYRIFRKWNLIFLYCIWLSELEMCIAYWYSLFGSFVPLQWHTPNTHTTHDKTIIRNIIFEIPFDQLQLFFLLFVIVVLCQLRTHNWTECIFWALGFPVRKNSQFAQKTRTPIAYILVHHGIVFYMVHCSKFRQNPWELHGTARLRNVRCCCAKSISDTFFFHRQRNLPQPRN